MKNSTDQSNQECLISKKNQKFNIDAAYEYVGGFGHFQVLTTIALTFLRNSGMYLYYGFGFLTLE